MLAFFRHEETARYDVLASLFQKQEVCWSTRKTPALLSAPNFKWEGRKHPVFFAILAQTLLLESSTANEEESSGSVFGMIGYPPGLSSSKGPFLSKEAPNPTGEGLCPSSFQPANGWEKAGSVRDRERAVGRMFMLLPIWTTWRPTLEIQSPWGP